jgi:hypothetical protein
LRTGPSSKQHFPVTTCAVNAVPAWMPRGVPGWLRRGRNCIHSTLAGLGTSSLQAANPTAPRCCAPRSSRRATLSRRELPSFTPAPPRALSCTAPHGRRRRRLRRLHALAAGGGRGRPSCTTERVCTAQAQGVAAAGKRKPPPSPPSQRCPAAAPVLAGAGRARFYLPCATARRRRRGEGSASVPGLAGAGRPALVRDVRRARRRRTRAAARD